MVIAALSDGIWLGAGHGFELVEFNCFYFLDVD